LRRPSPDLLETIYTMQRRQEWMREYLAGLGAATLEFIGSATDRTSALTVARAIRETLGLVDGWAQEHATWEAALIGLRRVIEAARVPDAGLISRDAYFRFLREHEEDEARKAATAKARGGGGDFYLTQENRVGRRFGRAGRSRRNAAHA
jgi:hypothetical protein